MPLTHNSMHMAIHAPASPNDAAKKIAKGIEKVVPCKRIGVAVIGLEVPHVHMHLVPMNKEGDLLFSNPRLNFTADEQKALAEQIAKAL